MGCAMDIYQQVITIITAIMAVQLCRHVAFLVFPANKPIPNFVQYLGRVLPSAVFGLLVIYCYKNIPSLPSSQALPQLLAGILVIVLHAWQKNMFLSIGVGTIFYMILVQRVFA